jgi:hypothetical protein
LIQIAQEKNRITQKHYEEKLNILKEDILVKKRIALTLEKLIPVI